MTFITKSISKEETACKCGCGENNYDLSFILDVQSLKDKLWPDKKIIVHCVCRCPEHNKKVGGASKSHHLSKTKAAIKADAIDFHIEGETPEQSRQKIDPLWHGGMELGTPTWIHIDGGPHRRFKP